MTTTDETNQTRILGFVGPVREGSGVGVYRISAPPTEAGRREAYSWVEDMYRLGVVVGSAWVQDRSNGGGWLVYYEKSREAV